MASTSSFPPVNLLDSEVQLTGFGREIADAAIAAVGGTATHIHAPGWLEVVEMLTSGQADLIQNTGFTAERTAYLDYTRNAVLKMPERIMVRSGRRDISGVDDLAGRKVACVNRHITHLYLRQFPEIECHIVDRPLDGLLAVVQGRADAFVFPQQIAEYLAHSFRLRDEIAIVGVPFRTLAWHMTVRKGNTQLLRLLDRGLDRIRENGTYDRIYAKWFGNPPLTGYSDREVRNLIMVAVLLSLLVTGVLAAGVYGWRMRAARDHLAKTVDELSHTETAWRESEDRYRRLVELLPDGVILHDANEILFANKAAARLHGADDPGDLVGLKWLDLVHPDQRARARQRHDRIRRQAGALPFEDRRRLRLDGGEFVAQMVSTVVPWRGAHAVLTAFRDITERQRAEAALRESEARYRRLVEFSPESIIVHDGTTILFANFAASRLHGFDTPDELIGTPILDRIHPDERAAYISRIKSIRENRSPGPISQYRRLRRDGRIIWVSMRGLLIAWRGKEAIMGIGIDVTARRHAEDRARRNEEELSRLQRVSAMGEFATAIAHELNQPLAAVMGYVQAGRRRLAALNHPDGEPMLEVLEKAAVQTERAGDIIRRLRGLIEKRELSREPQDLNEVVEEGCGFAMQGASEDGIRTVFDLAPNLPPVDVDRVQIQQAVFNLVRNSLDAMAAAPRRELTVRTARDGDDVVVSVHDTGPGILPDLADGLFERFSTTKADGMGVGLSISRAIVEAHGGRIWLDTEEPEGTRFCFSIPLGVDKGEIFNERLDRFSSG